MAIVIVCGLSFLIKAQYAELVNIQIIDPTIHVDLVFASGNNPIVDIPIKMYPIHTMCYIDKKVAHALARVQQELKQYGYSLKIRDAYRPLWAQKRLWKEVNKLNLPNPEMYISDPVVEGGRHTRGTAVDVTLIDLTTHQELPLPPFCFSEIAHRDYFGPLLNEDQINNREFLKQIMAKHEFTTILCEWWHFDYKNWQQYEPLNVSFEDL